MFRQRLLTTLVLLPCVLLAVIYAKDWMLGLAILLLVMLAGWEWTQMIPLTKKIVRFVFVGVFFVFLWIGSYWFQYWAIAGFLVWFGILFAVLFFPASQTIWGRPMVVGMMCLILLPLFAYCFVATSQPPNGRALILYLLFLVWAADIGAYLTGKQWGRHKLIPLVSPGKTIEGTVGGFMVSMAVAFGGYFYFLPVSMARWFVLAAVTTLVSVLGDLFISLLKRRCHLKDTGHIFPGHGGILDRIDSLIAATPFFYFGLYYFGIS